MTNEGQDTKMQETPAPAPVKQFIGSHLTKNYKEDTNPSGFLCGCTFHRLSVPCSCGEC